MSSHLAFTQFRKIVLEVIAPILLGRDCFGWLPIYEGKELLKPRPRFRRHSGGFWRWCLVIVPGITWISFLLEINKSSRECWKVLSLPLELPRLLKAIVPTCSHVGNRPFPWLLRANRQRLRNLLYLTTGLTLWLKESFVQKVWESWGKHKEASLHLLLLLQSIKQDHHNRQGLLFWQGPQKQARSKMKKPAFIAAAKTYAYSSC